jgi:hypothetical protein
MAAGKKQTKPAVQGGRLFKLEALWEKRFKELHAFQKTHGHCNVPRSYPQNQPLAYWVDKQRSSKRKGLLDRKTIARLNALGFQWSLLQRRCHRRDLDELVIILKSFKKRHGHIDLIAARGYADHDLLEWLKDLRKSKKQGRLDPQRIRQFERLGLVWSPREQYQQDFYAALLKFRKRFGHCRVPWMWEENRGLSSWVARMRAARKKNLLVRSQVRDLNQIGFEWNVDHRVPWEQHFAELMTFKKKRGHCNVPFDYSANPALGRWVSRTRRQKKLGTLSRERVRRLAAIGFAWEIRKVKSRRRKA